MKKYDLQKTEAVLRLTVALILIVSTIFVLLDSQTKTIAYMKKKVSFRDLDSLVVGMYINVVAAVYTLLQSGAAWFRVKQNRSKCVYLPWLYFFLDQAVAYVVLAGMSAGAQQSLLVVTGSKELQWTKWCGKFTRFCFQIGGAVVTGFVAAALLTIVSALSAFNLFRLYSSKRFLLLKSS